MIKVQPTLQLCTLLRPWPRTSSKFSGQELKKSIGTLDQWKLLSISANSSKLEEEVIAMESAWIA